MQSIKSFLIRFSFLAASAVVLPLVLPGCRLERGAIGAIDAPAFRCTATLRLADGSIVSVTNDDTLLGGGTGRVIAKNSTFALTEAERARDEWLRYLQVRLTAPAPSAEFQARFGSGPWCVVSADVAPTGVRIPSAMVPPAEAGAPLAECTMAPVPTACANPAGVVPVIDVAPPAVDFGVVPVGTMSADMPVRITNAGAGRLCLNGPALNATLSPNRADFLPLDTSDCAPRSADELSIGLTILDGARPTCVVRVRATPADPGARLATLRVNSTDPDASRTFVDVPLRATGDPGVLDYRATRCFNVAPDGAGCRVVRHALLNTAGPGNVTVRSVALPADALAAGWSIVGFAALGGGSVTLPFTLAPGAPLYIDIRACGATAPDTTLTFMSNASMPVGTTALLGPASGCTP